MFYYGYMAPSMMPMNQFAQLGPDDRKRQQTFSSFAENPRGNYDLYRELDR
ncbi:hypothetical protein M3193_10790 [Sporosarcina luteola]|uniref:hypothetical protein n=1 Tax=Sporosarcina luteola TaxID=582850 RepID=UPI00203C17E8|nr:hypothetical protein [Sporosarcina luteola]MCM3744632.1 hypothetical protein [Sporosarcina luteola]